METTAKPTKSKYHSDGNNRSEKVTEFIFLGTMISDDNNLDIEIHYKLLMANRCYHGLKKQNHITSAQKLKATVNFDKTCTAICM
jgi:hypothetical protein